MVAIVIGGGLVLAFSIYLLWFLSWAEAKEGHHVLVNRGWLSDSIRNGLVSREFRDKNILGPVVKVVPANCVVDLSDFGFPELTVSQIDRYVIRDLNMDQFFIAPKNACHKVKNLCGRNIISAHTQTLDI